MVAPAIAATAIPDIKEITPVRHGDSRGWFVETWNQGELAAEILNERQAVLGQSITTKQDELAVARSAVEDKARTLSEASAIR